MYLERPERIQSGRENRKWTRFVLPKKYCHSKKYTLKLDIRNLSDLNQAIIVTLRSI